MVCHRWSHRERRLRSMGSPCRRTRTSVRRAVGNANSVGAKQLKAVVVKTAGGSVAPGTRCLVLFLRSGAPPWSWGFPGGKNCDSGRSRRGPSRGLGSAMTCRTPRIQPRCRTACTRSAGPTSGSHARTHPRRFAHGPDALAPQLFLFVCRSRCEVCWKVARDREAPHKGWSRPGSRPKWPILPLHAKGRGKGL